MITEGSFVYVKIPGGLVREGRVASLGKFCEVRLEHNNEVIEVVRSQIWSPPKLQSKATTQKI